MDQLLHMIAQGFQMAVALVAFALGLASLWHEVMTVQAAGEIRELARQHTPEAIEELARLAVKARCESTRIAAIRELLDRGYGKPTQSLDGKFDGPPFIINIAPDDGKR